MNELTVKGSPEAMQELAAFLLDTNIAKGERVYTWEEKKCQHRLETREAYFPKLGKKGTVTWCENPGCDYVEKKVEE